ncbi:MAG: oligoendopeptidase F [Vicinamibacterales bacterium]
MPNHATSGGARSSHTSSRVLRSACAALVLAAAVVVPGGAQERDRARIPDQYKWDLTDIYPSEAAWREAKDALVKRIPSLAEYRGHLASSPAALADALTLQSDLIKELSREYTYASLLADQDTRDASHQGMVQEMVEVLSTLSATAAYIEPEILRIDRATIEAHIAAEPKLAVYRFYLEDVLRRAAHTLGDGEEKLLADAVPVGNTPSDVYNIFTNADFPYPDVTLEDGRKVHLDQAAFTTERGVPNRADRQRVMSSFFEALGKYRNTFGATMSGEVQKVRFLAKARHYDSDLAASLDGPNIPEAVYMRLIEGIDRNLPTFHRYLKLRKRMMKLDELHYYDLYAPLVGSVRQEYTPEDARKNIVAAMAPLGPDYTAVLDKAFTEHWIDLYPTAGKRSGAYSDGGAYDVHPYMLINYNGKYDDMSTLAHELGHTLQSYLSNKAQPFPLANYPIFVAEVASTFNEQLLVHHMLDTIKDDDTRLSLLGSVLENAKGTLFRQTQFAEFELRMHQMAEKGQPVTGEALANLYYEITKKYYGHDQGVAVVDPYIANEWSYIPHFYRDFYVFQYATSYTASAALAEKVLEGGDAGTQARDRYLKFLAAGGSKYPIELLKDAGVDMTTDEPLDIAIRQMNRTMDEIEQILSRRGQ